MAPLHSRSRRTAWKQAKAKDFAADEQGVALVEFALILPLLILLFAVTIDSARIMMSYHTTVSGVRDASRYLARIAPLDICTNGGDLTQFEDDLADIISESIDGQGRFVSGVALVSVSTVLTCAPGSFRISPSPVVAVTADLSISFPFASLYTLVGGAHSTFQTTVRDQNKVFGT
ncbi:TadE/TadG family type IV pilus assembly protein [Flavimaricola marinus]|uniref:TadE-like protein n=1 Tax=Flavimaricola marinus TaxID=1819565 RepID=A0A238L8Y5_9RHOB|nr:TadE/TadG family type IV pilus assembly protein [Flavimaricola marinus]SMY06128.1 TadE-like protein [Flavimaricola marinus]